MNWTVLYEQVVDSSAWTGRKLEMNDDKMTRKEAIDRLTGIGYNHQLLANREQAELFVDRLVVLGILKLKEKETITFHVCPVNKNYTEEISAETMIKMLKSVGYKIDKPE